MWRDTIGSHFHPSFPSSLKSESIPTHPQLDFGISVLIYGHANPTSPIPLSIDLPTSRGHSWPISFSVSSTPHSSSYCCFPTLCPAHIDSNIWIGIFQIVSGQCILICILMNCLQSTGANLLFPESPSKFQSHICANYSELWIYWQLS